MILRLTRTLALGLAVHGAPPEAGERESTSETEASETETSEAPAAEPTLEDAQLMVARDLHVRGEQAYRAGDYLRAIEAWTQVLVLLPNKQADLRLPLAYAHREAYGVDDDPTHLRTALELFAEQLASLEPGDTNRSEIEAEIAEIEAELAARAKAEAEAQAEREEAIRQEQIRINQRALAEAEAERQRKLRTIYFGLGGASVGVGVGLFAVMGASLAAGARLEREGHAMATAVGVPDDYYADQLAKGAAQNRIALATGLVGGAATAVGITLLAIAASKRQRARGHDASLTVVPGFGSVRLRF